MPPTLFKSPPHCCTMQRISSDTLGRDMANNTGKGGSISSTQKMTLPKMTGGENERPARATFFACRFLACVVVLVPAVDGARARLGCRRFESVCRRTVTMPPRCRSISAHHHHIAAQCNEFHLTPWVEIWQIILAKKIFLPLRK